MVYSRIRERHPGIQKLGRAYGIYDGLTPPKKNCLESQDYTNSLVKRQMESASVLSMEMEEVIYIGT